MSSVALPDSFVMMLTLTRLQTCLIKPQDSTNFARGTQCPPLGLCIRSTLIHVVFFSNFTNKVLYDDVVTSLRSDPCLKRYSNLWARSAAIRRRRRRRSFPQRRRLPVPAISLVYNAFHAAESTLLITFFAFGCLTRFSAHHQHFTLA